MPTRAKSPCPVPACHELTARGGRCAHHQRPTAARRGYGAGWRRDRLDFLAANPVCVDCGGDAEVPDHHPESRAQLVARGVPDPDAWEYLVPRCIPCHNRKTARTGQ